MQMKRKNRKLNLKLNQKMLTHGESFKLQWYGTSMEKLDENQS